MNIIIQLPLPEERRPDDLIVPVNQMTRHRVLSEARPISGQIQLDQALVLLKLIHAFVFGSFLLLIFRQTDPQFYPALFSQTRPPPSRSACGCACAAQSCPGRRIMVPGQLGCCPQCFVEGDKGAADKTFIQLHHLAEQFLLFFPNRPEFTVRPQEFGKLPGTRFNARRIPPACRCPR